MHNRILFYTQATLLLCIAVLHAVSLTYDLYWYYPLLNRVAHFSGGLWVALATIWILTYREKKSRFTKIIAVVLFVSVVWEIFEVAIGMTHEKDYVLDTSLDLIMDTFGGICGFFIARYMVQSVSNGSSENNPS